MLLCSAVRKPLVAIEEEELQSDGCINQFGSVRCFHPSNR